MGDDDQNFIDEAVGDDADLDGGQQTRAIPALLIRVLRYAAIGAGIVIVAGTTAFLVSGNRSGTVAEGLNAVSPQGQDKREALARFDLLDSVRGVTSDEQPQVFTVRVELGYEQGDSYLQTELNDRVSELENLVFLHVSLQSADDLIPRNYKTLQEDLKRQINRVLINGQVEAVWLSEFVVVQ